MMRPNGNEFDYRPCSGVMLLNKEGLIFLGRRVVRLNDDESDGRWWHMPQGGIDDGEHPGDAALRELYEETNVRAVEIVAEIPDWLYYDLPEELCGKIWGGRYRGQKQMWFAMRFLGEDDEIDIHVSREGMPPEFVEWAWVPVDRVMDYCVPFKRDVYHRVLQEFRYLTVADRGQA